MFCITMDIGCLEKHSQFDKRPTGMSQMAKISIELKVLSCFYLLLIVNRARKITADLFCTSQ